MMRIPLFASVLAVAAFSFAAAVDQVPSIPRSAGDNLVRSTRLAGGMPLGGIGCGGFELMTDGSVSRAAINNNWDQPTGDLKGAFAAVWTKGGGRTFAKALQLKNPYGLSSVTGVHVRGAYPQVHFDFPDVELPVKVSLRAFSPLIPHDVKSSSIPAAIFVFRITNEARGPAEASLAMSWENILGVGGTSSEGPFSDRTGNTIAAEPATEGIFGLRMSTRLTTLRPESRLRYNAVGNYALLTEATAPETTVTTASWNALANSPPWWSSFAASGTVEGVAEAGKEGANHPAGVVAVKVSLKDGETREIPFAIAWYTPRHWTLSAAEYGHYYEKGFGDSVAVARYALQNRLSLRALTEEWQGALQRSSLPGWLATRLMDDAAGLSTNTVLTRDSGLAGTAPGPSVYAVLESPVDGKGGLGAMDHLPLASALHSAFFPQLQRQVLDAFRGAQSPAGEIPRVLGQIERQLAAAPETGGSSTSDRRPDVQCAYAYLVYRYFRTAGDQKFLDDLYPSAKHAIQFAATLDKNQDGIPEGQNVYETAGQLYDSYSALLWLATLKLGQKMAAIMQDRRFHEELTGYLHKAQAAVSATLWNGRYFRLRPDSESSLATQLAGVWMTDSLGIDRPVKDDEIIKTIAKLTEKNDRSLHRAPVLLDPPADGARGFPAHSAAFQGALYARSGKSSESLILMERIDRMIAQSGLRWQAPLAYNVHSGAPGSGRSHIANAASWHYYEALLGFDVDLAEGILTLAPNLPAALKSLSAPIFSPTFIGWLDYRPGPRRSLLSFRLDRHIPAAKTPVKLQAGSGLTLKTVVIPWAKATPPEVFASVGRAPVPGKATAVERGRLAFTFEIPVKLSAGQRLEFILR